MLLSTLAYCGMPEVKRPVQQSFTKDRMPTADVESRAIYPEQRLWVAIILYTISDYEDQLKQISKLWRKDKKPLSRHLLQFLRVLKYEAQHEWFSHVCDWADVDQQRVVTKLKQLEFKYKLPEVKFSDTDNVVTRYQLRRAKKRIQYG